MSDDSSYNGSDDEYDDDEVESEAPLSNSDDEASFSDDDSEDIADYKPKRPVVASDSAYRAQKAKPTFSNSSVSSRGGLSRDRDSNSIDSARRAKVTAKRKRVIDEDDDSDASSSYTAPATSNRSQTSSNTSQIPKHQTQVLSNAPERPKLVVTAPKVSVVKRKMVIQDDDDDDSTPAPSKPIQTAPKVHVTPVQPKQPRTLR
jgi:hypothetical protein